MAIKTGGRIIIGLVIVGAAIGVIKYVQEAGMLDRFKTKLAPAAQVETAPEPPRSSTPEPVAEQPRPAETSPSNDAGLARVLEQGKR